MPVHLWRRVAARIIDLVILGGLLLGTLYLINRLRLRPEPANFITLCSLLLLYEIFLPYLSRRRSVGRAIAQIHLTRENGYAPTLLQYFARLLTRVGLYSMAVVFISYEFDMEMLGLILLLEGVPIIITARRTSLADLVARTFVVQSNRDHGAIGMDGLSSGHS